MSVTIIAEAGVNHNGIFETALEMVKVAKDCGADYIKFQTFFDDFIQPQEEEDYKALLEQCSFTKDEWHKIFDYCDLIKQKWISTAFGFDAIDFLKECGQTVWKIPSGYNNNKKYIAKIATQDGKIILSTGLCDFEEIKETFLLILEIRGRYVEDHETSILQCTTAYPCEFDEVNLKYMLNFDIMDSGHTSYDYDNVYSDKYGISDHTQGIEIPIAAVAMGAQIIEKHFTLDKYMEGPDHKASLEPHELKEMVRCIRNVELAMGDEIKEPTPSELKVRDKIRKRMGAI